MFTGKLLEQWRMRKGWTQEELASALGVKQPAIAKLETGTQRSLGRDAAKKLEALSAGEFKAEEIMLARFGSEPSKSKRSRRPRAL